MVKRKRLNSPDEVGGRRQAICVLISGDTTLARGPLKTQLVSMLNNDANLLRHDAKLGSRLLQ